MNPIRESATERHSDSYSTVTPDQIQKYQEQGFLIIQNAISLTDCDWLVKTYTLAADPDFAVVLNLHKTNPEIAERIVKMPLIVDAIEGVQSCEMLGCQTFFFFKKPGTRYANQSWNPHQDNSYAQSAPGAYLAVMIALDTHSPETGGVYLYPGSHKEGLLAFEPWTGYREAPGTSPGNYCTVPAKYENAKMDLRLNKGDLLIFDGNLIHASYPNPSKTLSRRSIVINYLKKGEPFIEGRTAKRVTFPLR